MAPLEPARFTARAVCGGGAAALGAVAILLAEAGHASPGASLSPLEAALASASLVALSLAPVSYRTRAVSMLVVGALLLAQGPFGAGPTGGVRPSPSSPPAWELARALAAFLLPAALLFRAHYRAFPRARLLLGWGLALAMPFVIRCGYVVVVADDVASRVVAGATIASVLLSLVGFMGAGTTAMGTAWASSLLAALSLDIAARAFLPGASAGIHLTASAAFCAASTVASFGLFQLLASHFACEARKIDVLRDRIEPAD